MTATQINAHLDLPKQTLHRLCTTLEHSGYIALQGTSKRYAPAQRLRNLAHGVMHTGQISIERRQILQRVAHQVGETVNFVIPTEDGMSYLDRVETDWAFRIQLPIGSHVPFHCTASGKTYMASLAPDTRARFVAALDLKGLTATTHTAPQGLLKELSEVKNLGYAIDNEEFIDGMVAIAVPISDPQGCFVAALAFHGPTQRISKDSAVARLSFLQEAAQQLGHMIASFD